ncbi:MAG: ATP-binding cassette domain-containing protein [Endozoicomonadaceae bacterium]|nr:ATP-binding cassette domain-containing protein [Endozoicomonadaceae bacterium]
MITLKNIIKYYDDHPAINGVSLNIPKGTIYGIIGESGAGKSTLLRCINRLEMPDSGQVSIDNQPIIHLKSSELRVLRKRIGMIFQHFNLLSRRNVYDNIALPLELMGQSSMDIKKRVEALLTMVDLTEKSKKYPHELSGGEKQRVGIARALVGSSDILLCDEATSSLDPNATRTILALLKKINEQLGITIVLITHEMDVARSICDHIAVMEKGYVVEHNQVDQIFLNPQHAFTQQLLRRTAKKANILKQSESMVSSGIQSLLYLTFSGETATLPIITMAARKFDVDFNILSGDLETIQKHSIGFLLVQFLGNDIKKEIVIDYFRNNQLKVEVI